jgi:glycosyltransferase involved in cell wall biosynthesis
VTVPVIAYDLTRLLLGPALPVPRGIDRVDLGYARYFFEQWPGECFGVLPLPLGLLGGAVVLRRASALRFINYIDKVWGETGSPAGDPAWQFLLRRLRDDGSDFLQPEPPRHFRPHRIISAMWQAIGPGNWKYLTRRSALPAGTVYVNTGQLGLAFNWLTGWLKQRTDIRRVYMLHDAIPLDYPDLVPRHGVQLHAAMLERTARDACGLIVTTEDVRRTVLPVLASHGRTDISVLAAPLPVPQIFLGPDLVGVPRPSGRYFVILGSIEPRKNHKLLLSVWKTLIGRGGPIPKLVIVGTPWRDVDGIAEEVRSTPALQGSVILVSGLTSPALRCLLQGAQALLQPSLVEGFGLPLVEALALGTPVIASDQPAHREAGGEYATYLGATDVQAWVSAISAPAARVAGYRVWDWAQYGGLIAPFLTAIARQDRPL